MDGNRRKLASILTLIAVLSILALLPGAGHPESPRDVVISEIAWMGTTTSSAAEWIELYNNSGSDVDLAAWTLSAADGTPSIALSGTIPVGSYFLLERTDDGSVPGVDADQTYSGALGNDGENLILRDGASTIIDQVDCSAGWFAGHDEARVPMVRVNVLAGGNLADNWTHNPRCGTATNSDSVSRACTLTLTNVGHALDYAVYFNERAATATETTTEHTLMEDALLSFINGAATSIDVALYGVNRQSIVNALIAAHNGGVTVRVVGDDDAANGGYSSSYQALTGAGITVITDASASKIQHNKFLVVDRRVVWTGSTSFTDTGLTLNANNSIAITDTTLAGIYATEFEEMWSGAFHESKADNTAHLLDYGGTLVESYFSPTDLPAFEVWNELANADETIHFAMFFWTDDLLSDQVVERLGADVRVYGVWDQVGAANVASQDETLCNAGARIGIESLPGKVHHKFAVIDVEGSDPVVVLGSYNWTASGAYDDDENTLIIHDRELARAYYAEWQRLWATVPLDRICSPYDVYLPLVLQSPAEQVSLRNPNFEGTFKQFAHYGTAQLAPEWLPWWKLQGGDDPLWKNRMPEFKGAKPYRNRIHSGDNAQQLFTFYSTHVAGVYQRVSEIQPGTKLRLSIWGQAWASKSDDPDRSEGGGPMHMRVGIDPNGGTDPFSAAIVWSPEQNPLDIWALFTVEAEAAKDRITVFTWSAPEYATKHNDVYWDDASLVVVQYR